MDTIQVTAVNKCSYPIRIIVGFEENSIRGIYRVLNPLEQRHNLSISRLAYEHLRLNPNVALVASSNE